MVAPSTYFVLRQNRYIANTIGSPHEILPSACTCLPRIELKETPPWVSTLYSRLGQPNNIWHLKEGIFTHDLGHNLYKIRHPDTSNRAILASNHTLALNLEFNYVWCHPSRSGSIHPMMHWVHGDVLHFRFYDGDKVYSGRVIEINHVHVWKPGVEGQPGPSE